MLAWTEYEDSLKIEEERQEGIQGSCGLAGGLLVRATVTKYYKLSDLNDRNFFSHNLEAKSQRSRCYHTPPEGCREGFVPGFSPSFLVLRRLVTT